MAKFKSGFVSKYKEDTKRQDKQQRLKEKHKIQDEHIVVVEKSNMTKFTVKMAVRLIKLAASICLLALAAIGLTTLIFPDTREAFTSIFYQAVSDTETLLTASSS